MADEKKRGTAMGGPAGGQAGAVQTADEEAMGRTTSTTDMAQQDDQVAMGQPATVAEVASQRADEVALGTPATAEEIRAGKVDEAAMGKPATPGQAVEQEIDEKAMGKPSS